MALFTPTPEDPGDILNGYRTIRNGYLVALANDSVNPQPDYSFEGQSVSRDEWRAKQLQRVKEINELICLMDPYEITTVQI